MKKHKRLKDDEHHHIHLCNANTPFPNRDCCTNNWSDVDCKNCLMKDEKMKITKENNGKYS